MTFIACRNNFLSVYLAMFLTFLPRLVLPQYTANDITGLVLVMGSQM